MYKALKTQSDDTHDSVSLYMLNNTSGLFLPLLSAKILNQMLKNTLEGT